MLKEIKEALESRRSLLLARLRDTTRMFTVDYGRLDPHAIKRIQRELNEIDEELAE